MENELKYIDDSSLIFMIDLLNCMINDLEDTLLLNKDDSERMKVMEITKNRLSSAYQTLNNYNIRRRYR